MFARYASAIAAGSLITIALLYAMQGLIGDEHDHPVIKRPYHELGWVLPPREEEPPRTRDLIDPDSLTDVPEVPHSAPPTTNGPGHGIPTIPVDAEPIVDAPRGLPSPDGPLIAMVRVQPVYPPAAAARELEGWVDVRFDVLANGQVVNVAVARSSNQIFHRAAIEAAQKFRFKAPVINGVPQPQTGVEYRFRFDMET